MDAILRITNSELSESTRQDTFVYPHSERLKGISGW
jgi:hypothetical protein